MLYGDVSDALWLFTNICASQANPQGDSCEAPIAEIRVTVLIQVFGLTN